MVEVDLLADFFAGLLPMACCDPIKRTPRCRRRRRSVRSRLCHPATTRSATAASSMAAATAPWSAQAATATTPHRSLRRCRRTSPSSTPRPTISTASGCCSRPTLTSSWSRPQWALLSDGIRAENLANMYVSMVEHVSSCAMLLISSFSSWDFVCLCISYCLL